jgi:hypothetical protein
LKIKGHVTFINDVGYHTFLDEVTVDILYRCSYNRCIISLNNVQYRTIINICKETIIQEITYMYNEECNIFYDEVSSDVFIMIKNDFISMNVSDSDFS